MITEGLDVKWPLIPRMFLKSENWTYAMTLTFSPPLLLKSFSKTILPEIPYEQSIRLITVALFPKLLGFQWQTECPLSQTWRITCNVCYECSLASRGFEFRGLPRAGSKNLYF